MSAPNITFKDVARSIGWLDEHFGDGIKFDGVDWSTVDEDGEVTLDGRKDGYDVQVTVRIVEVDIAPSFDGDLYGDDWDDDDE